MLRPSLAIAMLCAASLQTVMVSADETARRRAPDLDLYLRVQSTPYFAADRTRGQKTNLAIVSAGDEAWHDALLVHISARDPGRLPVCADGSPPWTALLAVELADDGTLSITLDDGATCAQAEAAVMKSSPGNTCAAVGGGAVECSSSASASSALATLGGRAPWSITTQPCVSNGLCPFRLARWVAGNASDSEQSTPSRVEIDCGAEPALCAHTVRVFATLNNTHAERAWCAAHPGVCP